MRLDARLWVPRSVAVLARPVAGWINRNIMPSDSRATVVVRAFFVFGIPVNDPVVASCDIVALVTLTDMIYSRNL